MIRRALFVPVLMGGAWTPAKPVDGITPGLWLDAGDLSGNDGDAIASWVSKEGNSRNFAQATADKKPLLKKGSNGINSLNAVQFDGTDDALSIGSNILTSSSGIVFVVHKMQATIKDFQVLFESSLVTATTRFVTLAAYNTSGSPVSWIAQRNGDTQDAVTGNGTRAINTAYLQAFYSTGTAFGLRTNGAAESLSVDGGANNGDWWGDTTQDTFSIGARRISTGDTLFYRGLIAEIIAYTSALSAGGIATVESYLANKYGISI